MTMLAMLVSILHGALHADPVTAPGTCCQHLVDDPDPLPDQGGDHDVAQDDACHCAAVVVIPVDMPPVAHLGRIGPRLHAPSPPDGQSRSEEPPHPPPCQG